jgi:hypothetical protein
MRAEHGRFFKGNGPAPRSAFGRAERALAVRAATGELTAKLPFVVFSPLAWDSLPEARRRLFGELSEGRTLVFVEDPLPAAEGVPDSWDLHMPRPRLLVGRPLLGAGRGGFGGAPRRPLVCMLRELLRWFDVAEHVGWLCTPAALPVARRLLPELLVCDGSAFAARGGSPELQRELLANADVVFAAGSDGRETPADSAARLLAELEGAARRLLSARAISLAAGA